MRNYCSADPTLPCSICPRVCDAGTYCDAVSDACMPLREAGEACTAGTQCLSGACTSAGLCSADQGEACTGDTCDGACAEARDGATYCVRSCNRSACEASTAGGLDWACIRFTSLPGEPAYCVPLDNCIGFGDTATPCAGFVNGECGASCPPEGCFHFCIPDDLGG